MTIGLDLVTSWGGFEALIAKLHQTGAVKVEHNVTLVGKSGAPRQIDVLVTHAEGLYTHRILVECKHWKRPVERAQIDGMVTAIEDLNAAKGVFFTTKGYQSGAERMAVAKGIDIFVVRDVLPEEWRGTGRVVDFFIHIVSRTIGNIAFPGARALLLDPARHAQPPTSLDLGLTVGAQGFESATPVFHAGKDDSLENILDQASMCLVNELTATTGILKGGENCQVDVTRRATLAFDVPLQVPRGRGLVGLLPKIECDFGVRFNQSRFVHDRSSSFLFALAVENCVTGVVYAASRKKDAEVSTFRELPSPLEMRPQGDLQKGSVVRVVLKSFFDFSELTANASA